MCKFALVQIKSIMIMLRLKETRRILFARTLDLCNCSSSRNIGPVEIVPGRAYWGLATTLNRKSRQVLYESQEFLCTCGDFLKDMGFIFGDTRAPRRFVGRQYVICPDSFYFLCEIQELWCGDFHFGRFSLRVELKNVQVYTYTAWGALA